MRNLEQDYRTYFTCEVARVNTPLHFMSAVVGKIIRVKVHCAHFQWRLVSGAVGRDFCSSELLHSYFMLLHVEIAEIL